MLTLGTSDPRMQGGALSQNVSVGCTTTFAKKMTYAANFHRAQGGYRGVPNHSYLPRDLPRGLKTKRFHDLCKKGLRIIRDQWDKDAALDVKRCGSKQSRQELWSLICRWSRMQAGASRVAIVPCIYLGQALAAHDMRCCRRTIARSLADLERWGLIVYLAGGPGTEANRRSAAKYEETRIGIRLLVDMFPKVARPVLRAQWVHVKRGLPGSDAFTPWRDLIARMGDHGETPDPGVRIDGRTPHRRAQEELGLIERPRRAKDRPGWKVGPTKQLDLELREKRTTTVRGVSGQHGDSKDLASKVYITSTLALETEGSPSGAFFGLQTWSPGQPRKHSK